MKGIWVLFVFLFSVSGFAQTETLLCRSKVFASFQIKNNSQFTSLNCADVVPAFESALARVQEISPSPLKGISVILYNQELPKGSRYSWVTSTATLDLPSMDRLKEQLVVFYHEVGHQIYFESMAKKSPEIQERREVFEKYIEYLHHCVQEIPDVAFCSENTAPDELRKANDSFSKEFDEFIYITTPYNELFADVVASIAAEEQNAISQVMPDCTTSDPACEYRAFSKNTIDKFAGENTHARFSPLRRDLWEGWILPRLNKPPELLLELADTFVDESWTHRKEDYALIEGMAALKQNKRLRERLGLKVTESPSLTYQRP